MAVDSSKKRKHKNDISSKKKEPKVKKDSKKQEEIFTDKTTVFEDLSSKVKQQQCVLATEKRKSHRGLSIGIGVLVFFLFIGYLLLPKIYLRGAKRIEIGYNQEYVEFGYQAKSLFKDITKQVIVNNNLSNKLGEYSVTYTLNYGKIKIKKTRWVTIVDKIKPTIEVPEDPVKVCPGQVVNEIAFKAIDGYDGDITDRVDSSYFEDKVILKVSDSADNEMMREIPIIYEDIENPKLTLKGNETIYLSVSGKYNEPGYTATDNCDGDITSKVSVSGNVNNQVGTYKLTYTVSDDAGNVAEAYRTVKVYKYNTYNSGTIGNGTIYFTFDDGPSQGVTNVILDILKDEGVKATFFVTCSGSDSLIKRIYDEGHTVALHTASHDYAYIYSSVDNYFADLNKVAERVKRITGIDAKIIRFPGGSSNTVSRQYSSGIMTTLTSMVLDRGYRYFDWNVSAGDAGSARSSSDVYNNVTRNLSKSRANVVLMHDTRGITRDALRDIINYAKANDYAFDKIEMDTYMIRHSVNN